MNFMGLILKALKNPRSLLGMGMIIFLAAVYILGPKIGLVGMKRLIAVAIMLLIFVAIQGLLAARSSKKKKQAAEDLEKSLIIEADQNVASASDNEKAARESARQELQAAIQVLKESQLAGGRGGKAALYVLPWFMVLGTDDSGKSEVIRNSGLQRPDQGPGDLVGIGSSPSCEWWFTNQAVILEADRRFLSLDEDRSTEKTWGTFLELLGKHHSRTPVNGVVITISAAELLHGSKEETQNRARLLRRRLDTMRDNLQQVFPVYVLVTKLDLLLGFDDFFAGISPEGAAQIFGATMRQRGANRQWTSEAFKQEFDLLGRTLRKRRTMRLVREENPERKDGTYLFPLEFQGLREPLNRFLETLAEDNAYGANPLLRGFYFVASGGGGQVADVVLSEVSQVIGMPGTGYLPEPAVSTPTGNPFFLKDFFRKVLVPDRHIARPTRGAAQQARLLRRSLQFTTLAAIALAIVLLTVSFGRNLALVSKTKLLTTAASNVQLASNDLQSINQALLELDDLRDHLIRLDELEHSRPLTLGLGMYRGNRVRGPALEVYLQRLRDILVVPSRQELFLVLNRSYPNVEDEAASSRFYDRYRVYRTLFTPHEEDAELLAVAMGVLWAKMEFPSDTTSGPLARLGNHVRFAMTHADVFGRYCGNEQADRDLQRKGNKFVRDTWRAETFYQKMINDINRKANAFRLDPARHRGLVSVSPDSTVDGRVEVPGSYTKDGWNQYVRAQILNSDARLKDDWLLREVFHERASGIKDRLLGFYERDYKNKWNDFLASVDLPRESDLELVARDMDELLDEDAPLFLLLEEAADNLRFKEDEGKVGADVARAMEQVETAFFSLHAFVQNKAPKDGNPPQDEFRAGVRGILDKLWELHGEDPAATLEFTQGVFDEPRKENAISILRDFAYNHSNPIRLGSAESNRSLQVLLTRPAGAAWRTCLEVTTEHLDQTWKTEVWDRFASTLNLKYPCFNTTTDATTVDYADFFGPAGALPGFLTRNMASFLESDGSLSKVYGQSLGFGPNTISALRKAGSLNRVLFATGKLEASCTLTAQQLVTISGIAPNFSASMVRIGNQSLVYRWGSAKSLNFTWPDEAGEVAGRVAVICLEAGCGKPTENTVDRSEWAFFRLLDQAELPSLNQRDDSFNIRWVQSHEDRYSIAVPYSLKAGSQHHPFRKDFLRFNCPQSLRD